MTKKQKKSLQQILIALALVILLKLLLRVLPALPTPVELLLYLIPYFVVGKDVLRKAGWDTHGLPIERQAIAAFGLDRHKVSNKDFCDKCKEYAACWQPTAEQLWDEEHRQ